MSRPHLAALLACISLVPLTACDDARCDPQPVGEAWKPYEALLPDAAVVCGPNRHSEKKPLETNDDYPPTHVFVFYEDKNPAAAFEATMAKFEGAGWQVSKMEIIGEGGTALYDGALTKDGVEVQISVNRNDWGTQGSLQLQLPSP